MTKFREEKMTELTVVKDFDFDGHAIRTMSDGIGEVWFVAKDVAEILGYGQATDMTRRLDDDEKQTRFDRCSQNNQVLITESGLYNAVLGSQKPEAKRFKKWVTSEVLPTIRKTGGYNLIPQTYSDALLEAAQQARRAEDAEKLLEKKDDQFKSVRGSYGNHVMQHNKYKHSKGEGFRHATIAHVKATIPGKYRWQNLANYCSYHNLPVEILTPHYRSVPLNSYPAEAWMAIYNIDISGL
ncbi:BRO family protein [Lelliottia sp. SL45]|uniref:BRO-N domain-containing protein n=1 Tax=Lelliottia sp. SL45 TaxID=2994665 RepID=UPI002274AABD|nr:BRO family protein [Lelliottia sp. SL45]MCY1698617.1 BRO family protein [Lelliottia sp. SL45]MCY1699716.1 BRO family protein [Lelliottia sp. SL45]